MSITSIHVVPAITEEASGPSYSVTRLCEALIDNDVNTTLAALDWDHIEDAPNYLETFKMGLGPSRLGNSPAMKRWLDEQVILNHVDVIHNHGMWQMNALYPGWAAAKGHIQLVVSPRGAFSKWAMNYGSRAKKIFWFFLQKPAFGKVTCFHATAEAEYEDIRRMGFKQPVAVIPNGIDLPPALNKKPLVDVRTLLFLGRIHPVKGIDLLLHVWKELQEVFSDWRLLIAGSDHGYYGVSGYLEEMRALSRELGLRRVEFAGQLQGMEKWNAYNMADLFILPSHSENFGMAVAEALASGTPAIVTKGAPWGRLITQDAGWWVGLNKKALVECLNNALSMAPEKLQMKGLNGRQWMTKEFSWFQIGKKMADTYRWLLDRSSPPPGWVRLD